MKKLFAIVLGFFFMGCLLGPASAAYAQKETAQKVGKGITKRVRGLAGKDRLDGVISGRVKVIDLTHPLNERTPYWPGPQYNAFKFETIATLENDKVFSGRYATPEHLGTHVDAPNHFVSGQASVDKIELNQLFGYGVVIDISLKCRSNPDYQLTPGDILEWEKKNKTEIPAGAIVFVYTGWGEKAFNAAAYQNKDEFGVLHFPGFSVEAADFLITARDINAIGIDTLSVDHGPSKHFEVHRKTHAAGIYHIENVANLRDLPPKGAFIIVAPIKIENGSGGQARVLALLE